MKEATPELIRKVMKAVGDISVYNTGVIGYETPLRSELSGLVLELIAKASIETVLQEITAAVVAAERARCDALLAAWDTRSGRWRDMPIDEDRLKARLRAHIKSGFSLRERGTQ
jgi:hypothetical protein